MTKSMKECVRAALSVSYRYDIYLPTGGVATFVI
ncbi:MAG: hypothetical protein J07HQW1_02221 [Haloquadratum walsbyi J07HQW1]|uniref:Uncharacterized protein n=1 Tax=Haloquadratum walsbyi J07HQW1 TaxID=1238424 RepID=U1PJ18_9EURY|nr:MAG: hypothetical protein J07HQW1_02221 [Haloquadratum walsbyi J07HQW1]